MSLASARKRVEATFGWRDGMRETRFRGKGRVGLMFTRALAAYGLVRASNPLREAEL
jgi:hypothetical protein